ncbi:MAG: glutathione S-transferase family protein [Gammaproteobacteria bacterium]|nr:glutathione S-transferase family protein [Gammaproteobacteria bacterium]
MSNNQPESLELYLFPSCPFAQRVNMSLIRSGLEYSKKVFTPMDMPENLKQISPLGNVPVLLINNKESIFESAVIADYIAQISPVSLEPKDEITRAQMRAWSNYSDDCFTKFMAVLNAENEKDMLEANEKFINAFHVLSNQRINKGPYFYGEQYTTIDSSYGPLFLRMKTLNQLFPAFTYQSLPDNISQWMDNLCNSDTLKDSIIGNFNEVFKMFLNKMAGSGYINQQLQK